jgi:prepilin-type N-terminal cleavage/methylation domain-containing protein
MFCWFSEPVYRCLLELKEVGPKAASDNDAAFFLRKGGLMAQREGFTLIEVIVVLVIVGLAAAFALPNFLQSMEQTRASAAKNNLLAISAGQAKYYEDNNNAYYASASYAANDLGNINAKFHLSMFSTDTFSYACKTSVTPYECKAWDGTVTLILNPTSSPPVNCTVGGNFCPS